MNKNYSTTRERKLLKKFKPVKHEGRPDLHQEGQLSRAIIKTIKKKLP